MSNIVKPFAIVDDTTRKKQSATDIAALVPRAGIIKRGMVGYKTNPYLDETLIMPDKSGYLDEINRLKTEIAAAKAELRGLGRLLEDDYGESGPEEAAGASPADSIEQAEKRARTAQAEAERLLAQTRKDVSEMRAQAEDECRQIKDDAASNGYLDGFDKGFAEAQAEFAAQNNPRVKELEDLLENISTYREDMLSQNERQLIDLTVTVCEKILGRELNADPRSIVTLLYKVLDDNRREQNMRIIISPELMPAEAKVAGDIRKLISQVAPGAAVTVDEEASPGSVVVETSRGITDLSVSTQLKNIKDMLLEP